MPKDRTPSGTPILRHEAATRGFTAPTSDGALAEAVERHMEAHVGVAETVFHEIVSDVVHIDVHVIAPTAPRPTWVLYTTGMSALPMRAPAGAGDRAELVLQLPADWLAKGTDKEIPPGRWWPIGTLKFLARLPHVYETWLGIGHTVPNGDPAEPYAEDAPFTGVVMLPPVGVLPAAWTVEAADGRKVVLLAPVFLTTAEMELKLHRGLDALLDLLDEHGVNELVDVDRAPMVTV